MGEKHYGIMVLTILKYGISDIHKETKNFNKNLGSNKEYEKNRMEKKLSKDKQHPVHRLLSKENKKLLKDRKKIKFTKLYFEK